LENDGILPLGADASVVVIGDFAKTPRYQGAGSSQVNPTKLDNLYDCLVAAGVAVTAYAQGFDRRNPTPNPKLIAQAVEVAQNAQTVLLCVGLDEILESEGMDRLHMELSRSQQELIKAVCAVNTNVILVLSGGAPFVMPEAGTYRAAIHGYLGGQAGAGAMVDAILGKVNPSGKLNETWPLSLEDVSATPYFPSRERTAEYREGLYVGYRYFESAGVPVRYPFGYGLSYTNFAYSDIKVDEKSVSVTVTNTGKCDGAEVVQLYVSCKGSKIYRPEKELKGFAKVFLKAGESQRVTICFDDKTFRYFDTADNAWRVEDADYDICIAKNAHEVVLSGVLHVSGKKATDNAPTCYKKADIKAVSDADFEALLGYPIPDGKWSGEITENDALCQLYYAKGAFARLLYKILTSLKEKADAKGEPNLNVLFIYNMPIRAMAKFSNGLVSKKMTEDILLIVNGHFWRGLGRLIVDFFKNLGKVSKFQKTLKAAQNK
jgi:beta-glucosidase